MRAHRKSGGRDLTEEEIRAEAHKRQKETGDAARAAEMTKEEVALEKRKGLAEKEAARKAATGQVLSSRLRATSPGVTPIQQRPVFFRRQVKSS